MDSAKYPYVGSFVSVLKSGCMRFLLIFVGQGWTVVRQSIGRVILIILVVLYALLSAVRDLTALYYVEHITKSPTLL